MQKKCNSNFPPLEGIISWSLCFGNKGLFFRWQTLHLKVLKDLKVPNSQQLKLRDNIM